MAERFTSIQLPHPEEPRSGVSKDAPGNSRANWSILRDAMSDDIAPQDEGFGVHAMRDEDAEKVLSMLTKMRAEFIARHHDLSRRFDAVDRRLADVADLQIETLAVLESRKRIWEARYER